MISLQIFAILVLKYAWFCFGQYEFDVTWDFNAVSDPVKSGWANGTYATIDMQTYVANGELRCTITGFKPVLDSPNLFLNVTNRHFIVMRAKYNGLASQGRLLLRSGVAPSPDPHLLASTAYWSAPLPTIPLSSSPPSFPAVTEASNLFDANPYTYYQTNITSTAYVILDLRSFRWIVGMSITPLEGGQSPRRLLLMASTTNGVGPFSTIASILIQGSSNLTQDILEVRNGSNGEQTFYGFQGYARYWKILLLDNYGDPTAVGIRDLKLIGYDERVTMVPFTWQKLSVDSGNNDQYVMYYLPIFTYFSGILLKMRFEWIYSNPIQFTRANNISGIRERETPARLQERFDLDYLHIVRAPAFWKVRGCLDRYFTSPNYQYPIQNITSTVKFINDHLPIYSYSQGNLSYQYATTYNCPRNRAITLTIEGTNFGINPLIFVGGNRSTGLPCALQSVQSSSEDGRLQQIICLLPALNASSSSSAASTTSSIDNRYNQPQMIHIENGQHPNLFYELPALSYMHAPPVPITPLISNLGAKKVDLVWTVPGDLLDHYTVTAYKIIWFQPSFPDFVSNVTVGNITTTSIRGLQPSTEYVFAIAAIAEDLGNISSSPTQPSTDLYGRRDIVGNGLANDGNAFLGGFSLFTNVTGTLAYDFTFAFFNSNQTLNNSGVTTPVGGSIQSDGPTGQYGTEGSYGLVLVGSANIANCNASSTCCDGFNASIGYASCASGYPSVCAVLQTDSLAYPFVLQGLSRRGVASNLPYANGAPAVISFLTIDELIANKGASLPNIACGPTATITPSEARSNGAMWYRRKMNVFEGFDTTITFQISNPSQKCNRMDDVNTFCRSRGADGWAFVIQNVAPDALGDAGSGLGYQNIFNALAVEMDTFHNFDQMDYYENHVAVMTQGFRYNISANHSYSLATSNKVPDLTDGIHTIRIKYDPNFNGDDANHPSFQVTGQTTWFLNNADFSNGGEGDWGTGFGLLYVYVDDLYSPVITTPLNLGATLNLDDGRAYVGITAGTGDNNWQVHDIISWSWTSLYEDIAYTPPFSVNDGQGAYACVNETVCVHPVNDQNYMRTNNIWGPNNDNVESWMSGNEGFCEFC